MNSELSRIFAQMAALLELTGANRFRVNAHTRVARVLKDMTTDVGTLVDDPGKLTAIDGIGDGTAKKIIEYAETGAIAEHGELLAQVPEGLLDVLEVQGLGPKTVKMLWEQADVTDLASLRRALDDGAVAELPRMGAKTIENIRASLDFAAKGADRVLLGRATPIAERIVALVGETPGTSRAAYAGSLRRGRETIGDVDVLAATTDRAVLAEAFCTMEDVERVLARGEKKCSVRLDAGVQVDLRLVDEDAWGAALLYFSGSKEHNVALRERAIKRDLRLNEYGLFPADDADTPPQQRGIEPVAAATEEAIYAALDLPWIPPELREDRGECDQPVPDLVALEHIRADLHAHTVASDGKMTIDELAAAAATRGYHTVAVTDHSKSSAQANGLDETRLKAHIEAVHEANGRIRGITILAGAEVDILADGRLDYDDDTLALLDIVVASPHVALRQRADKATARLLAAVRHPLVHILGHPTGRLVNRREGLSPDIPALVAAAAEHDTALEINANFMRLDLRDAHVRAAVEAGCLIAINTDAHVEEQFDQMRYGVLTARRGWLPKEQCINTWTAKKLRSWLSR